jgi:hypothetical protein
MKRISSLPKRIIGWIIFVIIAASLFTYLLAIILNSDRLSHFSGVICVPALAIVAIVILFVVLRWLFRWRNLRYVLLVLTGVILLIILFYIEEDFRGWWGWHKFKHESEAKGERFDLASTIPPPVPDDQNFALTPVVASSYEGYLDKNGEQITPNNTNVVDRMSMSRENYALEDSPTNYGYWAKGRVTDLKEWQNYYRAMAVKTNEFPVASQAQSPAVDVLLALSKYNSDIEEIRKASPLPYSRFPENYNTERPFNIVLIHLSALKRCSQVLELRAVAELENGQDEKALADVKLMLRLIDSTRNEPFLITHLVRNAMTSITMQPIWEGVIRHKWSDAQLSELNQGLGSLNFLSDYELCMDGERNGAVTEIESLRRHRDYNEIKNIFVIEENFLGFDASHSINPLIIYLMPEGWYYQNDVTVARFYKKWLSPMVDVNHQVAMPEIGNDAEKFYENWKPRPWNVFADTLVSIVGASARKLAFTQNSVNMARVACALERYHLSHGEFPETLASLSPQLIDKIPHDIIGGQPLRYHRTDNGRFLLYSVGWNETDDGGQIGMRESGSVDITKGDWVWPDAIN